MYRILDIPPADGQRTKAELFKCIHPDDRALVERLVNDAAERPHELPEHGVELDFRVVRSDGSVRELHALGRVAYDEAGRPERLIGAAQDITEQRLSERELRAHYAVSQALREWESFELGVVDLLRRIATALDYPMASMWVWDQTEEVLVRRAFWSAPHVASGGFEALENRASLPGGTGKPGLAWQTRKPVITIDAATDPDFRPRDAALDSGIASAVAVPAVGPGGPVAVLSFYALDRRVPNEGLMRTLTAIGSEVGHFLNARRAEFGPAPLTKRELQVLSLAAGGLSGPMIAEELSLSPSTVKTHFSNTYEKLGVEGRAAAVALALRTGLIQ